MNKYNAMRLFRQFVLIGCRWFCHALGAAHSNLSNCAFFFFRVLSIFSFALLIQHFFIILVKTCMPVNLQTLYL